MHIERAARSGGKPADGALPVATLGDPQLRSLDAVRAGDTVQVARIPFPTLAEVCQDLGIGKGDVIRCRAEGRMHLVLETGAGRTVVLERGWSRYIGVSDHSMAERSRSSAPGLAGRIAS